MASEQARWLAGNEGDDGTGTMVKSRPLLKMTDKERAKMKKWKYAEQRPDYTLGMP